MFLKPCRILWYRRKIPLHVAVLVLVLGIPQTLPAAAGHLELKVVDQDTGRPLPCRMHLKGPTGRPVRIPKLPFWQDHFAFPGQVQLTLPLGHYTFELERGLEYLDRTGHFTINQFADDSHQDELHRFVDMAAHGWYSGDLDVRRPPTEIELLMLADDLHVAEVVTWSNKPAKKLKSRLKTEPVLFDGNRCYHLLTGAESCSGSLVTYHRLGEPLKLPAENAAPFSLVRHVLEAKEKFPNAWIDVGRPFAWDLPTLVALGAVDSIQVANSHLRRGSLLKSESGGKPRDKFLYPDPRGNAQWSQDIYFKLLDCGLRIPPSAGSGSGETPNPVGYNRMYVHVPGDFSYDAWWKNLRAGRVFVTNGPLMRVDVDGHSPGHVFQADRGQAIELEIGLTLSTRQPISYLEIIKDGKIDRSIRFADYAGTGRLPKIRFDRSGWFALRAVTDDPQGYCFALTGPYYAEIAYQPRISKKAAQFFLDWVIQRGKQIKLDDPAEQKKILADHLQAYEFWKNLVEKANAD
ncbi:MAG: hypothetical protein JXB10_11480 [Pirellulales bacterium]|nr:hypothetical protein [Pirellulales bacterium]